MNIKKHGFTLIEVVLACSILMVALYLAFGPIERMVMLQKITNEKQQTHDIAQLIKDSAASLDPATNITISGNYQWAKWDTTHVDPTLRNFVTLPTMTTLVARGTFDPTVTGITPDPNAWYGKLGVLRGMNVAYSQGSQWDDINDHEIRHYAVNTFKMARVFLVRPSEAGVQRYMLISICLPPSRGVVWPSDDGSNAYFDNIWNNQWGFESSTVPADWHSRLSTAEINLWNTKMRGKTNAGCVLVEKISVPKYKLTINNQHLTSNAYAFWDGYDTSVITSAAVKLTVQHRNVTGAPRTDTSIEILAGRRIVVRQGPDLSNTDEQMDFILRETSTVTLQ
jgi:type II secretory pathway pseudopilin PulG